MLDCVEWEGCRNDSGYGVKRLNGKNYYAHRLAWMEVHGTIETGLHVCHKCDNPPCVRIEHLFLGTDADNLRDMKEKGRHGGANKTHCPRGHEYTEDNIYHRKDRPGRTCKECSRLSWIKRCGTK